MPCLKIAFKGKNLYQISLNVSHLIFFSMSNAINFAFILILTWLTWNMIATDKKKIETRDR